MHRNNFHLYMPQEDDLLRSVGSCKVEADVVQTWINFLEDTWLLQSSYTKESEKQTKYVELYTLFCFFALLFKYFILPYFYLFFQSLSVSNLLFACC